ncbi:MAG: hypothetical protein ABWZ76_07595 [Acidimicrobiales bacterium]
MAAPEFVPVDRNRPTRGYESPPRLPQSWRAVRPAEVVDGGQPRGTLLGDQGPDQGYVLTLTRRFEGTLHLAEHEHERDVLSGAAAIALKRASLFGRAPVIHDLTVALTVWGHLDEAPPELVALRKPLFEEVAHAHAYGDRRRLVDLVPEATLRLTPQQVAETHARDWRSLLALSPSS